MKIRHQVFVKWRFITSPDVEESQCGGRPWEGLKPEEVGEDRYHPEKFISVGPPFNTAEEAAAYALARGWSVEDVDIRPLDTRT